NSNIIVTSTAGGGVQFCTNNSTATAILTAGNTISVGPGGFSAGTLLLRQFTQQGSTPQSLTLTGTGNLTFGPLVNLGGNFTTVSPSLYFNGGVYNGSMTATKNGSTNDASVGNNTFNAPFAVTNTGGGYFLMGNGNPDTWQSTASFTNQSPSAHMYTAYGSTGNVFNGDVTFTNQAGNNGLWIYPNSYGYNTQFNGNIFVNNTTGAGIYFGSSGGTATLSGSGSISAGSTGFTAGTLYLKNFTQATAGTTQTITTTGTSIIQFGPAATFAGPVTSSSGGVLFNSSTFNGVVSATKTGGSNDQSPGNNTFNAQSTFTNSGSGFLEMTYSGSDIYNGNVTFVRTGSGALSPNYNNTGTYNGNVTVTSPSASAITFGAGTGTALFTGSSAQTINAGAGSATPVFTRFVLNNSNGVSLNTPVNVSNTLTLTSGLLNTTMTNILTMTNGSSTTAGTALSTSYVNGPMRYQKSSSGTSTLNFPVGTAPDCRPVILTVNHSTNTLYNYTIQLFDASAAALNYTLPPSVNLVSAHHYYILARTDASGTSQPNAGLSGNQQIQIFFGANDDSVSDGSTLTIVKNTYLAPTAWIDIGGSGGPAAMGGAELNGSITSTSSPSAFNSFSTFALANKIGGSNVLPTELLYFNAKPDNSQVDLTWATAMEANNDYFTVERSADGISFDSVLRVATMAPNGNSNTPLDYSAYDLTPLPGASYYRLKQTGIDGSTKYSGVISVNFTQQTPLGIYPNPSRGTVYVSGLPATTASILVTWYDLSGKTLLQQVATPQGGLLQLNTHFNNGDYILKLQSPDGTCTTRTVIMMK
ncbi:MAG TPA: T9SS type A sorting domain-containing protein, partial [Puia sp.]|nr:T9SS type A sorting domain-containing protein [Puia sp.]